ncbi:hypothetical protein [Albibacterium bauzanense]|uniref:Uncharacterized protein n=1 Tax=Albibacterium bauzanense TaxID=653929 RepID=A0A4R1LV86_9SPHI|nr:hypothetical protein [Albibacterium bauzanense]TCK83005.1 hypothetical protein C8N28_1592 [Albibacterium bauzanense]
MDIENGGLMTGEPQIEKPKPSSKIYFFIIAIAALLATNVYYAIRYKNLGNQVEVLNSQKNQLEIEVDRIEAELNRVTGENIDLAANFKLEHDSARLLIEDLRSKINSNTEIKQDELLHAQQEIQKLRALVAKYSSDLENLRKENDLLSNERDQLQESVNTVNKRANSLEEDKAKLQEMIKMASHLKISEMNINALRVRSGDRINTESKAPRVDRLQINFTLADNTLTKVGKHNIYLRVTEPSGNLITNGNVFKVNDEEIQYTDMKEIDFENDGKQYTIDWSPSDYKFKKGTYTVILYTNESTMGRSTISLK